MRTIVFLRRFIALLFVLAFTLPGAYAANPELEAEIERFRSVFAGDDFRGIRGAIGDVPWTGISDATVFDPLADKIKEGIDPPPPADDERSQEIAWYAKGLGVSGNPKYRPLLEKLSRLENETISRHSANALKTLDQYSKWNRAITKNIDQAPAGKLDEWRVRNMLESGIPELIRVGGKRIYFEYHDHPELTAKAVEVLLDGYKDPQTNIMADAMAWLCKGVSAGPNTQYTGTMKKVTQTTESYQVERYCEKAWVTLERMGGKADD